MSIRAFAVGAGLLLALVGCREESESPVGPRIGSQADAAATTALSFRQVSAGGYGHACGVTTDDEAYCWGDARSGALGNGTTTGPETCRTDGIEFGCSTRPVAVEGGLSFRQVSVGSAHTCGVTTDDKAYCWGAMDYATGQLGDGTMEGRLTPVAVAGGLRFRSVSAGWSHTCGVTSDNVLYCWGEGYRGQLGDGTAEGRLTPTAVAGRRRWLQVDGGLGHTCGIATDGRAYCWGFNRFGQVGDSTEFVRRMRPKLVAGGHLFRQIDAGARHTCGVTLAGQVYCWGDGRDGQLGNLRTYLSFWPRKVRSARTFESVTAGTGQSCGVTTDGRAYCWGLNWWGQLGDGTGENRLAPVAVAGGLSFAQLSAGHNFVCGSTVGTAAYCWGINVFGNLGIGTYDEAGHYLPAPVSDPM
jgi:alpha-tubulin suppressor-like RCC1 family protein